MTWRIANTTVATALLLAALPAAAGEYFDTVHGTSHMLQSGQLVAAVHLKSGHLKGLWDVDAGQQYVVESADRYYFETKEKKWEAAEKDDVITAVVKKEPGLLELQCRNAAAPFATIEKHYYFAEAGGQQRILCRRIQLSGDPEQPTLYSSVSHTIFDSDFRQDAWYHYVVPQGVAGNQQPLIPAHKVTRPIARRDHGTDENGRGESSAFNAAIGAGLAQYVFKVNDQWIYPRGLNRQTYWVADGWQIASAGFFIKPGPQSVETRYHLFFGDRLQFHFEYLKLPEFKVHRDATKPLPLVARIASPGRGTRSLRPGDKTMGYVPMNPGSGMAGQFRFGDFADSDDAVLVEMSMKEPGKVQRELPARQLKSQFAERIRKSPDSIPGLYIYRSSDSDVFKEHPDWVRGGNPAMGLVYPTRAREVSDFIAEGIAREAAYLGTGLYYIDGAIEAGGIDWKHGRVWQGYDDLYFWQRLYAELHKAGKILWTNMRTGSAYYDAAYYEVSGAHKVPGKNWRDGADADLMNKLYQVPGTLHIPLYWWVNSPQENNARYQNLCLGLAMSPRGGAWAHKVDGDWPVLPDECAFGAAVDEFRDARFVRIGLEPAWWKDLDTRVEGFTLNLGDTYLVNVISHLDGPQDIQVSVDASRMGFDAARPVFAWQHQARPALIAGSQYPDEIRDRLYVARTMTRQAIEGQRLSLNLRNMPVDRIRVTVLTQVPAFIDAVDGIPTQNLLPATLGCRLRGTIDEGKRVSSLQVEACRAVRVLAYWPGVWGNARVAVNGVAVSHEEDEFGGAHFLLFDLAKGHCDVEIRAGSS